MKRSTIIAIIVADLCLLAIAMPFTLNGWLTFSEHLHAYQKQKDKEKAEAFAANPPPYTDPDEQPLSLAIRQALEAGEADAYAKDPAKWAGSRLDPKDALALRRLAYRRYESQNGHPPPWGTEDDARRAWAPPPQ